jgi:cellulose synthase/poly-beta-1,6-N-acetylglucosamine synthase-like glycosyltransferase
MWVLALQAAIFSISLIYLAIAVAARPRRWKREYFPRVSVISWSWRDGNIIARKIKNFLTLRYPAKYEVIIVDNASEDETREVCERYAQKGLIRFYRTARPYDRKAFGLDEAIQRVARYEILAMTDPDGVCERNWLLKLVQPFRDPRVGAVIGLTHAGNWHRNWFTRLRAIEDEWRMVIAPFGRDWGRPVHLTAGCNYAVRRRALEDVGWHGKRTLGEDLELTIKLYARGWEVRVVPADVWQEEVENLREYVRQRLRWQHMGASACRFYARELWHIFRQRPLGLFLFFISPSIHLISLGYLAMMVVGLASWPSFLFGLAGFGVLALALSIGLVKVHREFLIPYIPLYLVIDPLCALYTSLLMVYLKLRGRRIVWRSLYDGYYHRGTPLALR